MSALAVSSDLSEECPPPEEAVEDISSAPKRLKLSQPVQDPPLLDSTPTVSHRLLQMEDKMCEELLSLHFSAPVSHIYNPLSYAAEPHRCFVCSYGNTTKQILFFGMNPGPFGMAQTGVGSGLDSDWGHLGWPRLG